MVKKRLNTSTANKKKIAALEEIIQTYHNYVAKIVYSILSFLFDRNRYTGSDQSGVFFLLWEKAEQIDTNKCEDIKYYLAAIAKHEVINERNKFVRMLNWMKM